MDENTTKIATNLRRIQSEGDIQGNFVIFIVDQEKNYYIQFITDDETSLYAEAVGNDVLAPEFALNSEQMAHLEFLGWDAPTSTPNFSRSWKATSDAERLVIANKVMLTFEEVYGISPNQSITVELTILE